MAEQLLGLAEHEQEPALLLLANGRLAESLFYLGEFVRAREHLTRSLVLYEPTKHRSLIDFYWQDPKVTALTYLSITLWMLGHADAALAVMHEAVSWARELSHPMSLAWALLFAARLHRYRRESEATEQYAQEVLALAVEQGFQHWLSAGRILLGWARSEHGRVADGIPLIRDGVAGLDAIGAGQPRLRGLVELAEAHLRFFPGGLLVRTDARLSCGSGRS